MARNQLEPRARYSQTPAAKLKRLALLVLVGGLAIAGLIYVLSPNPGSASADPRLTEYYDRQNEAAQRMWGGQGPLLMSLLESLKHARTYSVLVAGISVLGSAACFYLSLDAYDGSRKAK